MDTRYLIDAIVQQTTVLVAALSTAAGVRAPLSHVADQVFVDLARQIEAHGVSRKVAADMFGLALRTYQKKVARLSESVSERGATLWQSILEYVESHPGVSRAQLLSHFDRDDTRHILAVLSDLVGSGILYKSGRGAASIYRPTSTADRTALAEREGAEALAHLLWLHVDRNGPLSRAELERATNATPEAVQRALASLLADGRLAQDVQGLLAAQRFFIPVGDSRGWEAAVFDHFQAVSTAIAEKLQRGPASSDCDIVGGGTLTFDLYAGHPHAAEVQALLAETRRRVNALWQRVEDYDRANPSEVAKTKLTFYYGQTMDGPPIDAPGDSGQQKGECDA